MNVREMHIQISQALQKVAANRTRKFLPEEYDLVLNKMQGRFIQSKVKVKKDGSGGFEIDQLDIDALRPILVLNRELTAYVDTKDRYVTHLPADYTHLISDASLLQDNCKNTAAAIAIPETLTILRLRQERSPKGPPPFIVTMSITLSDKTVSIPESLPYNNQYAGYALRRDVSYLVPYVLQLFRRAGYEVYWENFDGMNYPATYVLVGSNITATAAMLLDGFPVTQMQVSTKDYSKHVGAEKLVANRLTASDARVSQMNTAFYKTSVLSPISELADTNLYTYRDDSFIVSKTVVSYLRRPQIISLALGTDCELAEGFHEALCDLSVEYLEGRLKDQTGLAITASDIDRRVVL